MKFGAFIFPTDYSIQPVELAKALEKRGHESVWLAEHTHIPKSRETQYPGGGDLPKQYYDTYDPFVTLTAMAVVTEKLKLGTGISLVVERDPIVLAKVVASLDQISNGRVLLDINPFYQDIIKGSIIVGALALDVFARGLVARSR